MCRLASWSVLLALSVGAAGYGQEKKEPPRATPRATPSPGVELKGQASVSVHLHKMEKNGAYRLTARGEGFLPRITIEDTPGAPKPTTVPAGRDVAQVIFHPGSSKAYRIKVDATPSAQLPDGPLAYVLTIERASFKSQLSASVPRLDVNEHERKLEKGKVYRMTVTGTGFAPDVHVIDGERLVARAGGGRWYGFGADAEFVASMMFAPTRTATYRIVVPAGPVMEQRLLPVSYSIDILERTLDLSVSETLMRQHPSYPRRGGPHRVHTVALQAGTTYQIDMTTTAFDAYLFLEDTAGNLLMEDDDSGGAQNARIVFRPTTSGNYRIITTTFDDHGNGRLGAYSLLVASDPAVPRREPNETREQAERKRVNP